MAATLLTENQATITRRPIYVIYFQLEGLCLALRVAVQAKEAVGDETRTLLRNILRNFEQLADGNVIEVFPSIINATPPADLLAIAETLRTSAMCFLTEHETEDRKKQIGFTAVQ